MTNPWHRIQRVPPASGRPVDFNLKTVCHLDRRRPPWMAAAFGILPLAALVHPCTAEGSATRRAGCPSAVSAGCARTARSSCREKPGFVFTFTWLWHGIIRVNLYLVSDPPVSPGRAPAKAPAVFGTVDSLFLTLTRPGHPKPDQPRAKEQQNTRLGDGAGADNIDLAATQ